MENIQRISNLGLSMNEGKTALAYGRLQWKEKEETITEEKEQDSVAAQDAEIDLSIISKVNKNNKKHREELRRLEAENRANQKKYSFKEDHPVRWAVGQLVKKYLL